MKIEYPFFFLHVPVFNLISIVSVDLSEDHSQLHMVALGV